MNIGEINLALKILSEIITLDSNEPTAYQKKGYCEILNNDYINAEKSLTKALEIEEHSNTYGLRGLARRYQNKYHKAINDYRSAIELNNNNPVLYYNLGLCEIEVGDIENACRNFNQAQKLGFAKAENMLLKHCK